MPKSPRSELARSNLLREEGYDCLHCSHQEPQCQKRGRHVSDFLLPVPPFHLSHCVRAFRHVRRRQRQQQLGPPSCFFCPWPYSDQAKCVQGHICDRICNSLSRTTRRFPFGLRVQPLNERRGKMIQRYILQLCRIYKGHGTGPWLLRLVINVKTCSSVDCSRPP